MEARHLLGLGGAGRSWASVGPWAHCVGVTPAQVTAGTGCPPPSSDSPLGAGLRSRRGRAAPLPPTPRWVLGGTGCPPASDSPLGAGWGPAAPLLSHWPLLSMWGPYSVGPCPPGLVPYIIITVVTIIILILVLLSVLLISL